MISTLNNRPCPSDVGFRSKDSVAIPLLCGSWNCATCSGLLARKWAGIARHGVTIMGHNAFFWTLTLPGYYTSRKQGYEALPGLWDSLRKDIQRHSDRWMYIAFVEGQPQRDFMPHFHILSEIASYKRLKDLAVSHGFGHQAEESEVTGDGAVDYVTKYSSKQGNDAPKGFRRVRCARSWQKPYPKAGEKYIVRHRGETVTTFLLRVSYLTGRDVGELWGSYQVLMGHEEGFNDILYSKGRLPPSEVD